MRILDSIFMQAAADPLRPAMGLADRIVTYDMLARGVLGVEQKARMARIKPGDLVVVALTSPIRHMIVTLALMRMGAVSVSVEEADSPGALQLDADWVLVEDFEDVTDRKRAQLVGVDWFQGFAGALGDAGPAYAFEDDEVCRLILSSGTTGAAKALAFTPRILADRLYTRILLNADSHAERTMVAPGLASQMGWVGALASLATGGFALFATTAETTLQMIDVYGVTNLVATANQIRDLLAFKEKQAFPNDSLRALQIGGGLISDTLMRRLQADFSNRVLCRYGSTETGIVAYAPGRSLAGLEGAVGFVAPWADVEVLDDDGMLAPRGQSGRLRVRTSSLAQPWSRGRTHLNPDAAAWFDPGDIGRVDARGVMYVTGRSSNVINVGGAKVSPEQVEELLLAQPGVRDAAVFAARGAAGFDEIWGAVVADAGALATIREAANARLARTPLTRLVAAQSIPRNPAGKIMRDALREAFGS